MTGWTIRAIEDSKYNRTNYWVMTAHMKSVSVGDMLCDPVYMLRKGYDKNDIEWVGMDALGSWGSL